MEAAKHASAPVPRPAVTTLAVQKKEKKPIRYPFWFGGSASSMAACVTHPLDLRTVSRSTLPVPVHDHTNHFLRPTVKVRLQTRTPTAPSTLRGTFVHILTHDGVRGLYSGLSASLLRQITYSTARFGIYEELKPRLTPAPTATNPKPATPLLNLIAASSISGFFGGIFGNVADVLNVRMQHDASLPPAQRRNYKHALHGLAVMTRTEGLGSWFRGVWPNSLRAAAMTAGQLASYDAIKGALLRHAGMRDDIWTHFTSSFLAGVVAATITSPIDVVKTRVMSAHGTEGVVGIMRELSAREGVRWMFKGWVPSFLRLGP